MRAQVRAKGRKDELEASAPARVGDCREHGKNVEPAAAATDKGKAAPSRRLSGRRGEAVRRACERSLQRTITVAEKAAGDSRVAHSVAAENRRRHHCNGNQAGEGVCGRKAQSAVAEPDQNVRIAERHLSDGDALTCAEAAVGDFVCTPHNWLHRPRDCRGGHDTQAIVNYLNKPLKTGPRL
jgi:hypothetical protein